MSFFKVMIMLSCLAAGQVNFDQLNIFPSGKGMPDSKVAAATKTPPPITTNKAAKSDAVKQPPKISLGTAGKVNANNDLTAEAVRKWLELGGRHLDTATMYYNLDGVRRGIMASKIPRDKLYITLKVHMEAMGFNETINAMTKAVDTLGVGYVDLGMIHWPGKISADRKHDPPCSWQIGVSQHGMADWSHCRAASWHALNTLKKKGLVKQMGVSNFEIHHLTEIFAQGFGRPLVNQIEFNPWWQQPKLVTFCQDHKIQLFAYNSLNMPTGHILPQYPGLADIGDPFLTLERWALTQGIGMVLGASSEQNMKTALAAVKMENLDSKTMTLISSVQQNSQKKYRKYMPDPTIFPSPYQQPGSEDGELERHLEPLFGVANSMFIGEKWHGPGQLRPDCWSEEQFHRTDCCHAALPPGGSSVCWGGPYTYESCCVPVLPNHEVVDLKNKETDKTKEEEYDYVVVGSGSTGSSVAARLAELGNSVVLLEMGTRTRGEVPRFLPQKYPARFMQTVLEWKTGMVSRALRWLTAKGLGGTSAVNGRLFTFDPLRDLPTLDQDMLAESANAILGDSNQKQEEISDQEIAIPFGSKLPHPDPKKSLQKFTHPGTDVTRWVARLKAPYIPSEKVEDVKTIGQTLGTYDIHRLPLPHEHASAFDLITDKHKNNLKVQSLVFANKLLFHGGKIDDIMANGVHASGVEVFDLHENNRVGLEDAALLTGQVIRKRFIKARKEVILSAGALSTPMLLHRSGIGPTAHLQRMKVETLVDNPHVGSHLQEHLYLPMMIQVDANCTDKAAEFISFMNPHPETSQEPVFEVLGQPDCTDGPQGKTFTWRLALILLRSKTAGRLVPMSGHPFQSPHVEWNPFYDIEIIKSDLHLFLDMVRKMWNELLAVPDQFQGSAFGINPDPEEYSSNYPALTHLSKNLAVWQHPSGSCALGKCIDNNLIVRGTRNVRVADASALPNGSSGHPEALLRVLGRYVADVSQRKYEDKDKRQHGEEEINTLNMEL